MMQVNVSVPQDQLAAAVRAEVGSIFKNLFANGAAPAKASVEPRRKRTTEAAAPVAPAAKEQGTKAPRARGGNKAPAASKDAPPKGTNADAVLSAVKGGADSTEAIATKTGLDKGQINSALAVLKRNGQIHSPSRGSYAA